MTRGTSGCILSALELETTAQPAAANCGSISFAMEASRAAKIIFGAPFGVAGDTFSWATRSGIAVFNRQRAASAYGRPSERSEAANQVTSNHGWFSSNWINRCPTMPVAPRIPTESLFDMAKLVILYQSDFARGLNAVGLPARDQIASVSGSSATKVMGERIFVEWSECALFRKDTPPAPYDPQAGHHGNRKIHAKNTRNLAPCEYPEQRSQRMKLDTIPHNPRRNDVILSQSPNYQKYQQPGPVLIAGQHRHHYHGNSGHQRADNGNEFQHPARCAQHHRIGYAQNSQGRGVGQQRQ